MFFDINKVEIITCKIEWKVNNTSKLKELTNRDQFLTSTPFYSPKCPSVTWELRLYLNTSTAYNKSSFETVLGSGISLIQKGIPNNIILKVKHSIYSINVNFDCVDIIKSEISNFTNQTETPKYLIDLEKTVHSDDSIFLFCEVEFVPYNINCIDEITIDDFSIINTSQRPFSNMYKQGVLTDCVIKIGNERIHAHRCILANNSVVFQKMFEQKWMLEGQNGEINIVDTSPECYRAMIDYFYNGEIDNEILAKLAYELYAIAHKYEVKSLMDICEQMMALKIDTLQFTQNIFYLQFYNLPILEKACIKYIAENRKTFLESCEWKNIEQNYTDKAFYLLRSTLINGKDLTSL